MKKQQQFVLLAGESNKENNEMKMKCHSAFILALFAVSSMPILVGCNENRRQSSASNEATNYVANDREEHTMPKPPVVPSSPAVDARLAQEAEQARLAELEANRPNSGVRVYRNDFNIRTGSNRLTINTQSGSDYVVLVKLQNSLVANFYIRGGDSESLSLPNGSYHVYFYTGNYWNPSKSIAGHYGAFEVGSFSEDEDELSLEGGQVMTYTLSPQINGNFSPKDADAEEAL